MIACEVSQLRNDLHHVDKASKPQPFKKNVLQRFKEERDFLIPFDCTFIFHWVSVTEVCVCELNAA